MLEMGVLPDVAAATSATMILFTSAAAAVVFLSFGGVPPAYAGLAFTIGLISTAAGQVGVRDQAEPNLEGYALRRAARVRRPGLHCRPALHCRWPGRGQCTG